ncbi:hypothetical protein ACNJYD_06625 [Bradyrhizobium sp. DASA03005]|uniref:hypothetical protein n=1 Tax=Bradyrhizobium sp. SPXBL-02 TaxID=3395912 RepID=UPI003F6F94F2
MAARKRVVLVSMPFSSLSSPSLALSLFEAKLKSDGHCCTTAYFSFPFARLIGEALYQQIADGFPSTSDLVGEWIFSKASGLARPEKEREYVEKLTRKLAIMRERAETVVPDEFIESIVSARDKAVEFVEDCAERVAREDPDIIGLTSVFQQHQASLALARTLKQLRPSIFTVLGGANCEGEMGRQGQYQLQAPCVDESCRNHRSSAGD